MAYKACIIDVRESAIKTKSKTSQSCLKRYVEETFVEKNKNVHLINQENR